MKKLFKLSLCSLLFLVGCNVNTTTPINPINFGPFIEENSNFYTMAVPREVIIKKRDNSPIASTGYNRDGIRSLHPISKMNIEVVQLPTGVSLEAGLKKLKTDPYIEYAEPNFIRRKCAFVNDDRRKDQYALDKISIDKAWDITMGKSNVKIAIVDSGIDVNHPDLKGQVISGINVIKNQKSSSYQDDNGHGTHIAGIIAGIANNKIGISGVAPQVKLMAVKVLNSEGDGNDSNIIEGIIWAADNGANIINLSLGGPGKSQALEDAVRYALNKKAILCAAMGNEGNNYPLYPAAYKGVIAVGATDENDTIAPFSNYGKWISVSAPGNRILSTLPTYEVTTNKDGASKNYDYLNGTSMATGVVSGVCGLIKSYYPNLTSEILYKYLTKGTDNIINKNFDEKYGYGRINAYKSLNKGTGK